MKPLVITPGDVLGIGPEVTAKAWLARRDAGLTALVLGDVAAMRRAASELGLPLRVVSGPAEVGVDALCVQEPPGDGPVELRAIREAVRLVQCGFCSALVTGPINKARLAAVGMKHAGHTDLLGELCGVRHPVMAFVGGRVRVALVTVHLPLRAVPDALTVDGIVHVAQVANEALKAQLGIAAPRLAICGLNPHAGDQGLLGQEELTVVGPAVTQLQIEGVDALGPQSAEAAFVAAVKGEVDLVVAMYHDQGLVPLKALDFGRTVNWTLGLPIIRTSVDHGTAEDIAWTGVADASSMGAAIDWALHLVSQREA